MKGVRTVPPKLKTKYADLITKVSDEFALDHYLVAAMVATESSFDQFAMRYEPDFRWVHEVEKNAKVWHITDETEHALQSFSYSLLQVMGGTARWQGYDGALMNLCKPEVGLYWGCKYLKYLFKKHGDRDKAILSYNAGSPRWDKEKGMWVNQVYLDKVLTKYGELTRANGITANS